LEQTVNCRLRPQFRQRSSGHSGSQSRACQARRGRALAALRRIDKNPPHLRLHVRRSAWHSLNFVEGWSSGLGDSPGHPFQSFAATLAPQAAAKLFVYGRIARIL